MRSVNVHDTEGHLSLFAHFGRRSSRASLCQFHLVYSVYMPHMTTQMQMPTWAARERVTDLIWLVQHLDTLSVVAEGGYLALGRGALFIDTTGRVQGFGHPFAFYPNSEIEVFGGEVERRMVAEYDPEREMVAVLLKSFDSSSVYRIDLPRHRNWG